MAVGYHYRTTAQALNNGLSFALLWALISHFSGAKCGVLCQCYRRCTNTMSCCVVVCVLLFFVFAVRAAGGGFTKISLGEKDLNGKV
jgi:hypothetical protein